jgi:hypothetical protein
MFIQTVRITHQLPAGATAAFVVALVRNHPVALLLLEDAGGLWVAGHAL